MSNPIEYGEAGERSDEKQVEMPAPTFWPLLLAFGLLVAFGGLAFRSVFGYAGLLVALVAALGWVRNVMPDEQHEAVPVDPLRRPAHIEVNQRAVTRLTAGKAKHRVRIPEEIHPYSAAIKGGLAGATVMAALACLYGLVAQHSIWYPVNLLAGVVLPSVSQESVEQLRAFDGLSFILAFFGHISLSLLVSMLYAVALPMFPKYAAFWAGILMPLIWSAVTAVLLNLINPSLNEHISWPWFVACQLGFGLVAGYIVARSTSIKTMQSWTLAERAFMHAPGIDQKPSQE